MENHKSSEIDGIPIKFYKDFLIYIENELLQLYQNILQNEKETTKTMKKEIYKGYNTGDQYPFFVWIIKS